MFQQILEEGFLVAGGVGVFGWALELSRYVKNFKRFPLLFQLLWAKISSFVELHDFMSNVSGLNLVGHL